LTGEKLILSTNRSKARIKARRVPNQQIIVPFLKGRRRKLGLFEAAAATAIAAVEVLLVIARITTDEPMIGSGKITGITIRWLIIYLQIVIV